MAKSKSTGLKKPMTFSTGTVLLFILVFAAVGAVALYSSFAAPAPPATLSASPNPATVYSNEVFTGCGYYPNTGTTFVVNSPYAVSFFGQVADGSGCVDSSKVETFTNQQVGTYKVNAWQNVPGAHNQKSKLMGSTIYTVQ